MTPEPSDGQPRVDCHGVVWTPRDGVWWGDIGHTGEDGQSYDDYRTWKHLDERRRPLTVRQ